MPNGQRGKGCSTRNGLTALARGKHSAPSVAIAHIRGCQKCRDRLRGVANRSLTAEDLQLIRGFLQTRALLEDADMLPIVDELRRNLDPEFRTRAMKDRMNHPFMPGAGKSLRIVPPRSKRNARDERVGQGDASSADQQSSNMHQAPTSYAVMHQGSDRQMQEPVIATGTATGQSPISTGHSGGREGDPPSSDESIETPAAQGGGQVVSAFGFRGIMETYPDTSQCCGDGCGSCVSQKALEGNFGAAGASDAKKQQQPTN